MTTTAPAGDRPLLPLDAAAHAVLVDDLELDRARRRWTFDLAVAADTPEDLVAAIATAVDYFRDAVATGAPMVTLELEVASSPHPLGGWRFTVAEHPDAPEPAAAARAAHIAAGGAVRDRPANTR